MSRRGDNIHKRKDGRWEGRYKCGFKENGSTKYRSVYASTYSECKEKLEHQKAEVINPIPKYKVWYFKELLNVWLSDNKIRVKGSTFVKYEHLIQKHIIPELGGYKLTLLSGTIINQFLNQKLFVNENSPRLSASYVRTMAVIIESALNYAVSENWCSKLATPINKPSISRKEQSILSFKTQMQFEGKLQNDNSKAALGSLIALHTGLRIGEICALRWSDISLNNNLLFVNHSVTRVKSTDGIHKTVLKLGTPKTPSSKRVIPISSFLRPILAKAVSGNDINAFVLTSTHKFVGTRTFDNQFRNMLKRNGLETVSFHTLRHTFATRCIEAGMDVKTLSEILGHASATTTLNTYVHSSLESKKLQIEKLYSNLY